jgi:hypothetical protein
MKSALWVAALAATSQGKVTAALAAACGLLFISPLLRRRVLRSGFRLGCGRLLCDH